jgi:hypothetical protein
MALWRISAVPTLAVVFAAASACRRAPSPPVEPVEAASALPDAPSGEETTEPQPPPAPRADASEEVAPAFPPGALAPLRREDWEIAIGKWTFAPEGTATCECKATSSLLWWKGARPKDFDAALEIEFLGPESSAGILFRARGEDFYQDATFYQFEWYTRGSHHDKRLSLMKKNPYWTQIVTPTFPEAPYKQPIVLAVRARGDRYETFVDGERVFEKQDATFVRGGKLGIHVFQPRPIVLRRFHLEVVAP